MNAARNIIVALHNVHSVQRVIEMAKICYGLGIGTIIISKAVGTAAQTGVPEAQKIAIRLGRKLIFVPDIQDAIDLLKPDEILLFAPKPYGREPFNPDEVAEKASKGQLVMLVFGGLDPGLSSRELSLGRAVYIETQSPIGSIGTAAIAIYLLLRSLQCSNT